MGQAREALDAGVDVVIAAGGDGTVRCVAEVLAGTGTPMGLVPLGTGNLLARNLGIDITDPVAASYDVLSGTDSPRWTWSRPGWTTPRTSKSSWSWPGLATTPPSWPTPWTSSRTAWAGSPMLRRASAHLPGKPIRAKISIDGQHAVRRRIRSVMVGNCGKIMGGVEIFPEAKVDDGILDVVILAPVGRLGWLGVLAGVFGRNKPKNASVEYFAGNPPRSNSPTSRNSSSTATPSARPSTSSVTVEPDALSIRMARPSDAGPLRRPAGRAASVPRSGAPGSRRVRPAGARGRIRPA